jgi:hypothetical protein
MKLAPQLPYSRNLAPFDFPLFGHMKGCLPGCSFAGADQFLHSSVAFVDGIKKTILQVVCLEWMERPRKCIKVDGDYIRQANEKSYDSEVFIRPVWKCSRSGETPHILCNPTSTAFLCGPGRD